ncbi:class I SAM-dependent methyltransferase [Streptomyces sp. SudanB52_2052]|uniref:class I SAM-dependent methyltransferase n=1 Tax=Streptomyces sp. SudanB52_2052 TaxID=3035276 RepID=UPI003F55315C
MTLIMDIAKIDGGTALDRLSGIVHTYPSMWKGTVIDVGCRTRELETALKGRQVSYVGVDVDPTAGVVADLGDRLPFEDRSAEVVTAFDVLEHTDDIYRGFSELCRVAREDILITLPNCYEVRTRVRHLRGKPISGKYGLPTAPPGDRHRWFFSLDEARKFVRNSAREHGWRVTDERALIGPKFQRIGWAVCRWPNLLCANYLARLQPGR